MLLDAGGAAMRRRDTYAEDAALARRMEAKAKAPDPKPSPEPTVRFKVGETHDGDACDCIDQEMTLKVGEDIILTHTCHDGRVDKVTATILSIDVPSPIEHGTARTGSPKP